MCARRRRHHSRRHGRDHSDHDCGGWTAVTDNTYAGKLITVTAPSNDVSYSSGRITINNSGSGSGNITSITVGPSGGPFVEVLNNSLSNFGSNSTTNRRNAASAVEARIDSYLNTNPWEYTARDRNQSGCPSTSGILCVDAPLSAGSAPNGYVINVTTVGGVSVSTNAFSGGQSYSVPTTVTNIGAGTAASSSFQRVDIMPSTTTYPKATTRVDCGTTPGVCTYAEEMTNFANWYAYYRTRMQTMKSATGQSFLSLNNEYRLGFTTINNTNFRAPVDRAGWPSTRWSPRRSRTGIPSSMRKIRAAARRCASPSTAWGNSTKAPSPARRIRSSIPASRTSPSSPRTVTGTGGTNSSIGDQDNVESTTRFCNRENGCYDGNLGGGAAQSLADVALYYYYRDLRTSNCNSGVSGADVCTDNVPHLHQ
ncbi:MAG: hypothetical protein M5R42_08985 [Rhodocyclaceae bacterium]|nr:hypothetical protein [Rhodocyclaceae bacterium]